MTPFLVLLAGPTCSGKTSLAHAIRDSLPQGACSIIGLDWYYRDLSHLSLSERALANFDHPDAFDWEMIKTHVRRLLIGQSVEAPTYNFTHHVRSAETVEIGAADVIVIEGILALLDADLRAMSSLKVYIDAPDPVCLRRRIERDTTERGRSEESVIAQFEATVLPMAIGCVRPTMQTADLVLDGNRPIAELAGMVLERIDYET